LPDASRGLKAKLSPAASAPLIASCASITPATNSPAPNSIRFVFGEALPRRELDCRVARAILQIGKFSGEPVTAASCAAEAGLSPSRFLHLFKEETGISFRSFRAWKRARHLLHFANQDINLAHLAQDIGYPRLHAFQPLDPPLLRLEAARDLFRFARSGDL
jgi:AraC-like DNA-binding protein